MIHNIYVNAPIQNTDFDPDVKIGKTIGLFTATYLNMLNNESKSNFQLWNNVLAKEEYGQTAETYSELTETRLGDKYKSNVLSWLSQKTSTIPFSDTSPEFMKWAKKKLDIAIDKGDVRIENISTYSCTGCDATISCSDGPAPGCTGCPGVEVVKTERVAMTTVIDQKVLPAAERMLEPSPTKQSPFSQYPQGTFTLNKRRLTGVSLAGYGFERDVLDAKVCLGMLPLYVAETKESASVGVIAARANQAHNLPHIAAVLRSQLGSLPLVRMVGLSKAPADYLTYLTNEGVISNDLLYEKVLHKLAPELLQMKSDMSPLTAERILFSRKA